MCGLIVYRGKKVESSELEAGFRKLKHRGPDDSQVRVLENAFIGFQRLSIMDLSEAGNQPFKSSAGPQYLVCNGEIYNSNDLRKDFPDSTFRSTSDCEVILPMILEFGIAKTCFALDAEFAFVFYDQEKNKVMAARDPIGIRPLFYGIPAPGEIVFASEAKAISSICETVKPFPPGHYYDGESIVAYRSMISQTTDSAMSIESALIGIKEKLEKAVVKRLIADAPVAYLLSGGLDSSLVCAIAAKYSKKPIKTFSVGTKHDAIDNKYAEQVAEYIGADHTTVTFEKNDVFNALEKVIESTETWDVTTIRASVGMYLVCQYIRENTDTKVLLTGEVSDELFGYKYTDFAPSSVEFQKEAQKRVQELHLYDVLRADRCLSAHSLEARVPFGDLDFVDHVMSIPPELKMNTYGHGKYLLRKAFADRSFLPESILFREKAAFSDAVGHSVVDDLKQYAEDQTSDKQLEEASKLYDHNPPQTKEALLYRRIFDKYYPGHEKLIPALWLPNSEWHNCDVTDPSARVLPNYGESGS